MVPRRDFRSGFAILILGGNIFERPKLVGLSEGGEAARERRVKKVRN